MKKSRLPSFMKLPRVFVVGAVVLIAVVGFFVLRGSANQDFRDLALTERPYVSLVPRSDGHWLKLTIENFKVEGASTLEYELIYQVPEGTTQGVPGTVEIAREDKVERDLLLGSESAGKFRYDEGVTDGELNLRFRNSSGKLLAQLSTPWRMLKGESELALNKFTYKVDTPNEDEYLVVVDTFGLPKPLENATGEPYGVFASGGTPYPGTVTLASKMSRYDGANWGAMESDQSPDIGVFVETSN